MANYSKINWVKLSQSCIAVVVKGNWNPEEWEGLEKVERETKKLRREAVGRLDEDNVLEGKITQDHHLYLQPNKRLKICPLYKGEFPE